MVSSFLRFSAIHLNIHSFHPRIINRRVLDDPIVRPVSQVPNHAERWSLKAVEVPKAER